MIKARRFCDGKKEWGALWRLSGENSRDLWKRWQVFWCIEIKKKCLTNLTCQPKLERLPYGLLAYLFIQTGCWPYEQQQKQATTMYTQNKLNVIDLYLAGRINNDLHESFVKKKNLEKLN